MLNGQNNYQTAPPGAGGGFPLVGSHGNMQGMQYGMGPGRPGPGGMNPGAPQARGQFMGGMQGGMQGNPGGPAGVFNAQAQMNGGLGLGGAPPGLGGSPGGARQSMDRGGSGGALLQRQGSMPGAANGNMMGPSAGAPRGMMGGGGAGSFGGGGGIPGPRGSGPDLLAMINKGGGGVGMGGSPFGAGPGGMGMGGMGEDQTPFDMSEFPSLGGPPPGVGRGGGLGGQPGAQGAFGGPQGAFGGMGPGQGGVFGGMDGMGSMGADGYGAMALQKPHPEFTIQNEDFPALPGAPGPGGGGGGMQLQSAVKGPAFGHPGPFAQGPGPGGKLDLNGPMGGGAPYEFGGAKGGSTKGASGVSATDRFGLLGLLGVIRMSDPDLTTLALGTDLTTLGLNLNSPEPLYKTFGSPWADTPPRPEVELLLPACYSVPVAGASAAVFQKFQQETLFYVFYSTPGDESQLFAADELCARGWGFHKELKAWIMRVAGTEPVMKSERGERGSFYVFDVSSWERIRKDNFNLQYDQLEQRPELGGGKENGAGAGGVETKPPAGGLLTAAAGK